MKPLIDGDILLHEIGWSGEFKDSDSGEMVLLDFDHVQGILDSKIQGICDDAEATEEPTIFFSDSEVINNSLKKSEKFLGRDLQDFIPNFRYKVAVTKPYKGTRNNPKPFHFYNLFHYMWSKYDCVLSVNGFEADDMMGVVQTMKEGTIICSRDKDLRIIPGNHFSWECGKQRSLGPTYTDRLGRLELHEKQGTKMVKGERVPCTVDKVVGYGLKFFYLQMLMGDSADNIPGLNKWGEAKSYEVLKDLETEEDMFNLVKSLYKQSKGDEAKQYFLEQANLLWISQHGSDRYSLPKFSDKSTQKGV